MFLFSYTIPGSSAAWFITDGVNGYRWITTTDKAHFGTAGVPIIASPSYIGSMFLYGPTPP